jgi:hypothetical protein
MRKRNNESAPSERRCAVAVLGWFSGGGKLAAMAFLLAAAVVTGGIAQGQDGGLMSRAEAIEVVFDVLVPAELDHSVTAFLCMDMLAAGDVIGPWDEEERERVITSPTWFCWIDDDPQGFFEHATRFVFIDAVTGAVEIAAEGWWPVLNGESLFMSDAEWTDPDLVIYSCVHTEEIGGAQ